MVATSADVEPAIAKFAGLDSHVEQLAAEAAEGSEGEEHDLEAALEDAPIVKLVNAIMSQAVAERASDVHIEPGERDVRIRFRVDGVLHEPMRPQPKNLQGGLISRLKVMADLNIAEKRVPQDGRISMKVGTRQLDLRVATLPTVHGEKVVIRVLDKSNALLALEQLGFMEDSYDAVRDAFSKPYGAILVTGPTGSGKSTTMYSTLNILNEESKNIITVEDPVEYRMAGRQPDPGEPEGRPHVRVALRSILRADPDIVLIGEIRDKETATIAIEAALTGHLVLSSLHTNDAPSAISRLVEMDVETFLVASAIDAVVAQRLARILCEKCKQPYRPDEAELRAAGFPEDLLADIGEVFRAPDLRIAKNDCKACSGTGYRGRIGLYEVMLRSEEIERLTVERASADAIRNVAIQQGMQTLREDGLAKVRAGITSIEEVARVVK